MPSLQSMDGRTAQNLWAPALMPAFCSLHCFYRPIMPKNFAGKIDGSRPSQERIKPRIKQ